MDTPRTVKRPGPLLALALAATTALSVLSPTLAAPRHSQAAALQDVVVTSAGTSVQAVADAVRAAGGTVLDALPLVGGVHASLPAGATLAPAFSISGNVPITLASKKVASDREATAVREALGLGAPKGEGAGLTIAIVDTGVHDSPDFAGRITHVDVTGTWKGGTRDPYGHGTFVAGVAAGSGAASDGRYAGVAPGAHVLDVRVSDDAGETDLVHVLKGLEAAQDADVVNLSMSSGSPLPYQLDPLTLALDRLWTSGVVVVVPTGNDGPEKGSVTSPGSDPMLLTVGSLDEKLTLDRADDDVPDFSGRGPAPQNVSKPDLVAPGRSLVSLRSPGSTVDTGNPSARVDAAYFRGSGTSFSTAAVAGAAATLLQARPELTPDQVKALVTRTAYSGKRLKDEHEAGRGGLDLAAARAAATPVVDAAELDAPPPGDVAAWHDFLQALMDGERTAAAKAWSRLSPQAHKWAAHKWAAHKWAAHKWGAHKWGAHKWAGADASADEWEMRFWAAHKWAAHKWASDDFVAHKWAAHKWAAHKWASDEFVAHKWAAHKWAAHKWAASKWADELWG